MADILYKNTIWIWHAMSARAAQQIGNIVFPFERIPMDKVISFLKTLNGLLLLEGLLRRKIDRFFNSEIRQVKKLQRIAYWVLRENSFFPSKFPAQIEGNLIPLQTENRYSADLRLRSAAIATVSVKRIVMKFSSENKNQIFNWNERSSISLHVLMQSVLHVLFAKFRKVV